MIPSLATLPEQPQPPLAGLRVVADCAHGAAYLIAPQALRRAGAEVITIGDEPDGLNINEGCGSTALGALSAAVVEHGADAGIAYDGDADRCLAVDADGQPLDGDQIMTVLATGLKEAGRLAGDAVVVTVMSNQGFHVAMRDAGIAVIETPVGDKHVSAAMRDGGYVLGGEQSGHIIMLEHATTGDGVLTSLQLLAAVNRHGVPMAAAAKMMPKYPQVLVNVPGDASRPGSPRSAPPCSVLRPATCTAPGWWCWPAAGTTAATRSTPVPCWPAAARPSPRSRPGPRFTPAAPPRCARRAAG